MNESPAVGGKQLWAGRILSGLPALFLLIDGIMKLIKPDFVVQATVQLGYPEGVIVGLGVVLTSCTAVYLISRTAVLGAILLTGYLGGAVATHVRFGSDWFSKTTISASSPVFKFVFSASFSPIETSTFSEL